MIPLWEYWFDAREHRRAREYAERKLAQTHVRLAYAQRCRTAAEELLQEVTRERDALAEAADGRNGLLYEELTNVRKANAGARSTIAGLRREVGELRAEKDPVTSLRVDDQHAQVSTLPPALTRDRQALSRLSDELATARERVEKCEREHRWLELALVGPGSTSPEPGPALCDPWCPGCENPIHERAAESTKEGETP